MILVLIDEVFAHIFKLAYNRLKVYGTEVLVDIDAVLPECRG